ncbi:MAG: hypothetical protein QOK39_1348 [Acidimicrobiaceae bacterium]|jgi:hypothetical protein|nr:hypothetical protein [Acidimicrobiaceae bacterium]
MIRLDASTVVLQWAVGGLFFGWVTTRRRLIGIGYGWLLRGVYLVMAVGAVAAGRAVHPDAWRDACSVLVAAAAGVALVVSIARRRAGMSGQRDREERRSARVAAMTGIDRETKVGDRSGAEFPPWLDLLAPAIGVVGLIAAALADGGPPPLAIARTLVGAAFLGSVTDAMLLGHWYLVQPGLGRGLLNELVRIVAWIWPFEVAVLLWPTGMIQVLDGQISDSYGGLLGWFWVACVITTLVLCLVTEAALKERYYSAVMAATGLLYLAILTAFGTDLVARAILSA